MASRRAFVFRRSTPFVLTAMAGGLFWVASGTGTQAGATAPTCTSAPCVAETAERLETPQPVERPRRPSAPVLDWRSLLPAGFLRPR